MNTIKVVVVLLAVVMLYGCQNSESIPSSEKSAAEQVVTNSVK